MDGNRKKFLKYGGVIMALSFNYNVIGNMYIQGQNGNLILINNTSNISVPNAYIKIINQNGSKERIHLDVGIFDKKDGNLITTDSYDFTPDISSAAKNFIQQGYEQLKANVYQTATDLLDEGQTA